ncbi:MAG: SusC/RagA family TonB-linked outer membrane protein [Schleiferiaceae bacterium]|nr:SusC/RagA family TonB-linked outer membrane protein [Schleiferiaceae bacterium]
MNWKRTLGIACVFLLISPSALAQGRISGSVKDANGAPLPGAAISVDDSRNSALTDNNGMYSINVTANQVNVTATMMGYVTARKSVSLINGSGQANFSLTEDAVALDDIVVIGYGTSNIKDLTGSVVSIKSKSFQKGSFASPEALILGKTPGVRITSNSGMPGAGSRIRIRGGSSLNASNDPLIVIDGLPADGLGLLNPSDIESFTILKDASATAIYGSRAANGVILVTTKKGKANAAFQADVTAVTSFRNVTSQVDVLSTEQFRNVIGENGTSAQQTRLATSDPDQVTDWQKEIYQTGRVMDYNVALTGGLKMPYRLGLGMYREKGVLKRSELKRYTATLNASPSFMHGKLKANTSAKIISSENFYANQGAIGTAVFYDPTRPVLSGDTAYGGYFEWTMPNGTPSALSPRNPVGLLELRDDVGYNTRALGNILFDYQPLATSALHLFMNVGGEYSYTHGNTFVPAYAAMNFNNGGEKNQYESSRTNRLIELYANYNEQISNRVHADLTGGYSFQHWSSSSPSFPSLNALGDTISPANPFPYFSENALMSFYGRGNFNISNKYLLTATLRSDGSSRFSKDARWGLFPSAALAWNMLEEDFFAGQTVFSNLKLRLGYGLTGQQDIYNDYGYIPNYNYGTATAQYQFGNNWIDILRPDAYDYNLQWEKTATTNIALDYGLLKGRINGSLDFYTKNTFDLLGVVPIPAGTNFSNRVLTNVGSMTNNGIEASVNLVLIDNSTTNFEIGFNASRNRNQITQLSLVQDTTSPGIQVGGIAGGVGNTIQIHAVGMPMYTFYSYEQIYDANGRPLERNGSLDQYSEGADVNGNGKIDDIEAYVDQNGDGLINTSDLVAWAGKTPEPRQIFGFTATFSHKRWSGGMTWRAEQGQYMYNNLSSNHGNYFEVGGSMRHLNNLVTDYLNTGFRSPQYLSSYYIQEASFIRLDNLYLSYNLGTLYKDKYASSLNISMQNALVITKYKGLDPEIAGGIDNMIYPRPRVINLQLNVSL